MKIREPHNSIITDNKIKYSNSLLAEFEAIKVKIELDIKTGRLKVYELNGSFICEAKAIFKLNNK